MNFKFLFLVVLLAVSGVFFAATQTKCVDSDGNDVYHQGYVAVTFDTGSTYNYTDFCTADSIRGYSADYISEYLCSRNEGYATPVLCPTGYTCSAGTCVLKRAVCTDTDGGKVYTVAGRTYTDSTQASSDYCVDSSNLMEYFCVAGAAGDFVSSETHACGTGYECKSGACVIKLVCTDEDGINYYTASKITYTDATVTDKPLADVCVNTNRVMERTCSSTSPTYIEYDCPSGYECSSGACVVKPDVLTCQDSDGGKNLYTKGTTNVYKNGVQYSTATDSCVSGADGKTVTEISCSANDLYVDLLDCPSGYTCSNGACVVKLVCTDEDGVNYYTASKITYTDATVTNKPLADVCVNTTRVMERTCTGVSPTYVEYNCPSGYTCSNGACIQKTQVKTCVETDNGKNKNIVGSNTIYVDGNYYTSASDYCKDTNTVAEITCNNGGWDVSYETCDSGYECQSGACVALPATVTVSLKVIASDTTPAGISSPSASGVTVYLKDLYTGEILDSKTTTTDGVTFSVQLDKHFYVTTSATSALGGSYGFLQELDGGGVPSYKITQTSGSNYLCKISDNVCSPYTVLILYKLIATQNSCGETDNGENIYVAGTATGYKDGVAFSKSDYCSGSSGVFEFSCSGSELKSNYLSCPSGKCTNNVCVQSTSGSVDLKLIVQDGYGNGVPNANTIIYYQDPEDSLGDVSKYVGSDGSVYLPVALDRPFIAKAFTYSPYQAYGKSGGYCGEGTYAFKLVKDSSGIYMICKSGYTSTSDCSYVLSLVLYPNNCAANSTTTIPTTETSCSDGTDNDQDGGPDCFDADCSSTRTCNWKDGQHVCCLYHSARYGTYADNINSTTQCLGAGRYAVLNEDVCKAGIAKFGYTYGGKEPSNEQPPTPPLEVANYTVKVKITKGWQIVSSPVGDSGNYGYVTSTNCKPEDFSKFYVYSPLSNAYAIFPFKVTEAYFGSTFGYWVKKTSEGACIIELTGTNKVSLAGKELDRGWNQIGGPYDSVTVESIKGNCNFVSGPWEYVQDTNSWGKITSFESGKGYFVKVSDACTLGSDMPPLPPS